MTELNPVFITTCSMNKEGGGQGWPDASRPGNRMIQARGGLYDQIKAQGRQEAERRLRGAKPGPDLVPGSVELDGSYLPAYKRYAPGSFMLALNKRLAQQGQALDAWLQPGKLFFVSGLYGLVEAHEPIQNYDVEMSWPAADHWLGQRSMLAKELCKHKSLPQNPIVLNCCGDFRYSEVINWEILGKRDIPLFHAKDYGDPFREGSQIRAESGKFAAEFDAATAEALMQGEGLPGIGTNADLCFREYDPRLVPSHVTLVFEGLRLLPDALEPFVERVMEAAFGEGWPKRAIEGVHNATLTSGGQPRWDEHLLLHNIDTDWTKAFEKQWQTFDTKEIWGLIKELRAVRNKIAHNFPLTEDDAERALDSMHRLVDAVGNTEVVRQLKGGLERTASVANQLRQKRDFIRRKRRV